MIAVKSFTPDPLEEILYAARKVYPRAKVDSKDPEDQRRLILKCIRNDHISIFTHAHAKIEITCSRCVVRELQEQNSYVTVEEQEFDGEILSFITPCEFLEDDELKALYTTFVKKIRCSVTQFLEAGKDIDYRYILPGCVKTDILISMNFLEWLRILKLEHFKRTSRELKEICKMIYSELNQICNPVFNKSNLKMKL